jgi:hypothetical protein
VYLCITTAYWEGKGGRGGAPYHKYSIYRYIDVQYLYAIFMYNKSMLEKQEEGGYT